jgi:hypothetical protein
LKIYSLKRNAIPKIAVLATGLTAAVLVATINPTPAQAHVGYTEACDSCHDAGGSVTATPSSATVAPGATYTVALAFTGGGSPSGYWISGNGVNATGSSSTSATMTAPVTAGAFTYTVWVRSGVVASTTYSITVGAVVPPTTVPPTTIPPTTLPPTTVPPTTVPPTTVPPTTVPPTTVPPTTIPPTTVPPTTVPPTTVPPTTVPPTTIPPVATSAHITSMSPRHGAIGTKVTIRGSGFGDLGSVRFGTVVATAKSWTDTKIVFEVPAGTFAKVAHVSVISGDVASNAFSFRFDKGQRSHHSFGDDHSFGDHHSHRGIDHRAFCGGDND